MPRVDGENLAEDFLFDNDLIKRRSVQRRALLGCVGCKWLGQEDSAEQKFYGLELIKCSGIKSGVVYPILDNLVRAGVMVGVPEDVDPSEVGRPPRTYYYPRHSQLAEEFKSHLEIPEVCTLEAESSMDSSSPYVAQDAISGEANVINPLAPSEQNYEG